MQCDYSATHRPSSHVNVKDFEAWQARLTKLEALLAAGNSDATVSTGDQLTAEFTPCDKNQTVARGEPSPDQRPPPGDVSLPTDEVVNLRPSEPAGDSSSSALASVADVCQISSAPSASSCDFVNGHETHATEPHCSSTQTPDEVQGEDDGSSMAPPEDEVCLQT